MEFYLFMQRVRAVSSNMLKEAAYINGFGRIAVYTVYEEPTLDDDGLPDGWQTLHEMYIYSCDKDFSLNKIQKSLQFVDEFNAELFLTSNGYYDLVG